MSPEEILAMHNAVIANPEANAILKTGNYMALKDYLNSLSNPAFKIWRTNVDPVEIMQNGMDWTRVDNLSVGKARIWEWLTKLPTFNAAKPNVRAGIDAAWVGTAADLAVRANVYTHCKRTAYNSEKIMATGTGTDASPATPTWEGEVSEHDAVMITLKEDGSIWST